MTTPIAVAPGVKTPGTYLSVDLLGGVANPGNGNQRILVIATQNTTGGDITDDTEVRQVFGADDAAVALGEGNVGHLAVDRIFAANGNAPVDVISPTAGAGAAATGTQTFSGSATENSTIRFRVHGRTIDVGWLNGEAVAVFQARAVAAINGRASELFVTVGGVSPDIDYTAKAFGPWGNDVRINASVVEGGAGITISVNPATLTTGVTEPDITNALATVATRTYRRIVLCASNADASATGSSANPDRLKVHINALDSGNQAKLQVGMVGHTGIIADVKAGAIDRNEESMQYTYGQDFEDLPGEVAGWDAGDAMAGVAIRPNYNRIGNQALLYGPADVVTSKMTGTEIEDLLRNGVTPIDLAPITNQPFLVRPITTHSLNGVNPDFRAFDMSDVDGTYSVGEDLQQVVPVEFANASLSPDLPPGADPLPPGVVEEKDIKAFILSRFEFWATQGVIDRTKLEAALLNDELIFQINATDPTQFDVFGLAFIIKPLAKIGVVLSKSNA